MLGESTARYAHAKKIGEQDGVDAADRYWQILMHDDLPQDELDRRHELLSGLFSRTGRREPSYFMRGGIFEMPMGMTQKLPDSVMKWNVLQYKQAFDKGVRQRLTTLTSLYEARRRGEKRRGARTEHLFNQGEFTLHSGGTTSFLIDCNALTDEDLAALAKEVSMWLSWRKVVGVPEGGLRFAEKLSAYNIDSPELPVLIADDVWTTGASMEQMASDVLRDRDLGNGTVVQGVVIFARSEVRGRVHALFQMASRS
jgi:hypothetical protein